MAKKYVHMEKVSGATWRLSTCVLVQDLGAFLRRLEGDDVEFVVPGTFPYRTVKKVDEVTPVRTNG